MKEEGYSLRPLNAVIADYLPSLTHHEMLVCLKMLKSNDIHQFSEPFLKALHNRYSDKQVIGELMKDNGAAFLLDFAHNWPFFLSNQALTDGVLSVAKSAIVKEQSTALKIMASKNILHTSFLRSHFETFTRLKDRGAVAEILPTFVRACAYLGHADAQTFDVKLLFQLFRRIYKDPEELHKNDASLVLDLLTVLAISQADYRTDFDAKTTDYIEKCLDLVQEEYRGMKVLEVEFSREGHGEKAIQQRATLHYHASLDSEKKLFNKVLVKRPFVDMSPVDVFVRRNRHHSLM